MKNFIAAILLVLVSSSELRHLTEGEDFSKSFSNIYSTKAWSKDPQHPSGPGSIPTNELKYLINFQHIIDRADIKTIVEVGFGDFQMTGSVIIDESKNYTGFQVVPMMMRENKKNYKFNLIKNIREIKESGDLLVCRDVMQHWPTSEINWFIKEIVPRFKYALLTNDYTPNKSFGDTTIGGYRSINMDELQPQQVLLERTFPENRVKRTILWTNPKNQ